MHVIPLTIQRITHSDGLATSTLWFLEGDTKDSLEIPTGGRGREMVEGDGGGLWGGRGGGGGGRRDELFEIILVVIEKNG